MFLRLGRSFKLPLPEGIILHGKGDTFIVPFLFSPLSWIAFNVGVDLSAGKGYIKQSGGFTEPVNFWTPCYYKLPSRPPVIIKTSNQLTCRLCRRSRRGRETFSSLCRPPCPYRKPLLTGAKEDNLCVIYRLELEAPPVHFGHNICNRNYWGG